jgi:hypothetical protein
VQRVSVPPSTTGSRQLSTCSEVKVLVLVNDDSMDFLDLREALDGYMVYGTPEVGFYRNVAARRVAEGRIREEKHGIDLYVWINRYEGRHPWRPSGLLPHEEPGRPFLVFGTDAGYALARTFFGTPEVPKPQADPNASLPTLRSSLRIAPDGRSANGDHHEPLGVEPLRCRALRVLSIHALGEGLPGDLLVLLRDLDLLFFGRGVGVSWLGSTSAA